MVISLHLFSKQNLSLCQALRLEDLVAHQLYLKVRIKQPKNLASFKMLEKSSLSLKRKLRIKK